MNFFTDYLNSIITVGICSFLCEAITSGKRSSPVLDRGLSLLTSLCIFITATAPLFSGVFNIDLADFSTKNNISETSENYFLTLCENETERILFEYINSEYDIENIDVRLIMNENGETKIDSINYTIGEKSNGKETEITNAIIKATGEDIKVTANESE